MPQTQAAHVPPPGDEPDPLDRVLRLSKEIETHKDRVSQLFAELDAKDPQLIEALKGELSDTFLPLLSDLASAVGDALLDEREYITEEIAPAVFGDEDEEDEEDDDSVLVEADAKEYTALLSGYRALLIERRTDGNEDTKIETDAWIARVDKALARTAEITEEVEPDEKKPE